MKIFLAPCRIGFKSSQKLANVLGARRIKLHESRYRHRSNFRVVNWGRSDVAFPVALNQPEAVAKAINKRSTWDILASRGIPTVCHTIDPTVAQGWLDSGVSVYRRETLTAFGGRGLSCIRRGGSLPLPLFSETGGVFTPDITYTKRFPTRREFRVLVVGNEVALVSEKKKRRGSNPDPMIRSHEGYVFCRHDLEPYPSRICDDSIAAIQALGLDFGGVDIAVDKNDNTCVLEVNTAPGIDGESVPALAGALLRLL